MATLRRSAKLAFTASVPVLAGYLFLGSGYGVLMRNLGYGPGWTALMSLLVFGGSIQFLATGLLATGTGPVNAFILSLVLNARHIFYGFAMLARYAGAGWKKPFLIFWLSDETFSLLCSDRIPPGADANWFRFLVSGFNYVYWLAGGLIGNLATGMLTFNAAGIEFVMTALFAVIVIEQWLEAGDHFPALAGAVCTLACLLAFGSDYFIIPSMVCIVAALLVRRRWTGATDESQRLEGKCGP